MTLPHDIQEQVSKIDQQIIDLLEERMSLCQEALNEDDEALGSEYVADTVGEWEAWADEKGWNLHILGKVCRAVIELCKSVKDD